MGIETSEQMQVVICVVISDIQSQAAVEKISNVTTAIVVAIIFFIGLCHDFRTCQDEFGKALWKEQLALYQEGCDRAAAVAVSPDLSSSKESRDKFWQFYWGRMSILEHPNVKRSMQEFGGQLQQVEAGNASI